MPSHTSVSSGLSRRLRSADENLSGAPQPQTTSIPILRPALSLFAVLALILGLMYPLFMTGFGHLILPEQTQGSLIRQNDTVVGSMLIGQQFDQPQYLWGRPSAAGEGYDATQSSGSNLGPLNPELAKNVQSQLQKLKAADPDNQLPVPIDLVTMSASGLDPHITPAAAAWQATRVAKARGLDDDQVQQIIEQHTEGRQFGFLGEPRVNVLAVNLALDELKPSGKQTSQ